MSIIISEMQEDQLNNIPVQIFATDLTKNVLRDTRNGEYSRSHVQSILPNYLMRYFTKVADDYRIIKDLREMCIFAPHNILLDPTFSCMDLVSCRNLLIYFASAAQKKVFTSLPFEMNDTGFLMLGKAKSIGTSSQLLTLINNKFKIYSRKNNAGK